MKSDRNILIAFLLNFTFSLLELIGGTLTGSVAIVSDAVHDFGDTVSIAISYFLERKSKGQPDATYTFGYGRYSVIGSVITTLVLMLGSILVLVQAVQRLFAPQVVHSGGMLLLAVIGLSVNLMAALVTREGDSLNQKAVNLHMLEDVIGWAVVLVGAAVMLLTNWTMIDPLLSIGVAIFILCQAVGHLKESMYLFLEAVPEDVSVAQICEAALAVKGVSGVHHVHVWSTDGSHHFATMHIVAAEPNAALKEAVRHSMEALHISHITMELEFPDEQCAQQHCVLHDEEHPHNHGHHHHRH
ncbi:MAG: cation diffusion facilitator family transporter [Oscillospiraceae bacterium]|nr:cation diffusion facilitator family transporter [Oscillospiraceae bacterium]